MIAIKGMEILPRSCMNCDMFQMVEGDYGKCRCYLTQTYVNYSDEYLKKRADYCPLVEIDTCKNCKHITEYNIGYSCTKGRWERIVQGKNYGGMGDFYCADFERRGGENGKK